MRISSIFIAILLIAAMVAAPAGAQGLPPSPVVTAKVVSGDMAPQSEFIGTVFFTEIANVASEVAGKVVDLKVEDGQRVRRGDVMVVLSATLLERQISRSRALVKQAKAEYEFARLEHQRVQTLFQSRSVAEGEFDSKRLTADGLQSSLEAAQADLGVLLEELDKKTIRAPFDGVVIDVPVARGEWMAVGSTVAEVARDDHFDVVVNAPSEAHGVVRPGMKVAVRTSGAELTGEIFAVIPKGDVATRTFPVKIRVDNNGFLAEGMEARVSLPRGAGGETLVVPRDAIIVARGEQVVWTVQDGKAVAVPVHVVGYKGLNAGVKAEALKKGMDVVVKGNERLNPGQPVAATSQN
ncbi:efflux RND transporter periplasmic adaptor subunit [Pseudodesulfovibrio sp. F-1]|uniref:Efflux RND transporter periplasmic adaptor subunit n=1 Tax=Pseudodesulfovibrio alkaliphilus TaxID=2661613 RepID=A0A7K1KPE1_9BACT|nr:efflux RND transporter periplasmic adaptor subunit [Pseudodesulfovibrio alkaliphilus]MUM77955.1 efflux RND transporter periplasmic adaptor subunit [Pseudodesulfovibrio alkaliphilus]